MNEHPYTPHQDWLLRHARSSLRYGVRHGHMPDINLHDVPAPLREHRATFVTLEKSGHLRGCIGHLEASQPLALDVAENAVAAAIHDPRFPPVSPDELDELVLSISILTPPEPMDISREDQLTAALRPGMDGLILQEGRRRATFLPSVWAELPDPGDFIRHLKCKAGWEPDYWSSRMQAHRYQSIYISEADPAN